MRGRVGRALREIFQAALWRVILPEHDVAAVLAEDDRVWSVAKV